MTCVELRESLAENENGNSPDQWAHLRNCTDCASLVSDLLVIACTAGELRAAQEPSPHVWRSIETALRQEGLIRPQTTGRSLLPTFASPWNWARWLAPAAAALLVVIGIYVRQHSTRSVGTDNANRVAASAVSDTQMPGLNDDDLLQEVSQQSPALQQQYTDSLRRVNAYIADAKNVAAANPGDEDARRSLMDAYQEKAMLFELALDRSLQ
jgi:hypothetical protein